MEVKFDGASPGAHEVYEALQDMDLGSIIVQKSGEMGMLIKFRDIDEPTHQEVLRALEALAYQKEPEGVKDLDDDGGSTNRAIMQEERFESIGPVIGEETKRKAIWAIALVLITILVYIAWAFRKISYPLGSWVYGLVALAALFHDVIITAGAFAILGYFFGAEVGVPFVAALLTILGYSVNDTIVVFDRIRENVSKKGGAFDFQDIINTAVSQTYVRSLNTSLTTFFVLASIFFFGGVTIKYFVMALMIGVAVGTYSSIFLASPLLFSIYRLKFKEQHLA